MSRTGDVDTDIHARIGKASAVFRRLYNGWLRACGKARGHHFEHLQLTYSVQSHPHSSACGVLKRHYFRVRVFLGSAETLVRRGGIINHHSIAYSLSNISAKNYRNRLMWVESIMCITSASFFWDTV